MRCARWRRLVHRLGRGAGLGQHLAKQILYEIGDPAEHVLPDVIRDFRAVQLQNVGGQRVRVTAVVGREPTASYTVSATFSDGYQLEVGLAIRGIEAIGKAQKTADALLKRTRRMMAERGFADDANALVEVIGALSNPSDATATR